MFFLGSLFLLSTPVMAERSGEQIYNSHCIACHMPGIAGAPKKGSSDWAIKLEEAGSLTSLVQIAKNGKNAMPPMGTCMDCSDSEMENVITYLMTN